MLNNLWLLLVHAVILLAKTVILIETNFTACGLSIGEIKRDKLQIGKLGNGYFAYRDKNDFGIKWTLLVTAGILQ